MVALLAKMGQREWAIVAIVLALLLAVGWYFLFTQPLQNRIPEVESQITTLSAERDKGRAAQRALPQLRDTIARLEAERQQFLRELPPTEQLGRVIASLSQQAKESNVVLRSFGRSSGDSQGVSNVRATNIALQVESPWVELNDFLKRLEASQRFATISGLTLTLGGNPAAGAQATATVDRNPTINTSLTMTVYTYTGQGSGVEQPQDSQSQTDPNAQPASDQTQPGGRP